MRLPTLVLALVLTSTHDDWPNWRGPARTGVSAETSWSSEGRAEPLWVADVGRGYSAPSVAAGRLFTRGFFPSPDDPEQGVDVTFCLDATTGEEIWIHESAATLWGNMHGGGTLTTPAVAGGAVFVLSRLGSLLALDAESGEVRWTRPLSEELEVGLGPFGFCSSPVVSDGVLLVNAGKTVALDPDTGALLWRTRDYGPSYATPEPFELEGRKLLAVFNAAGLAVLERESGEEVDLFEWTSNYNVNAASPIVVGNRIFISTGYDEKGCAMLELTEEGLSPVWESRRMSNKMNGCVLVDGHLFGFDGGTLRCMDLEGNERWSERGLGLGTVVAAGKRLIVLSEEGELLVAPASAEAFRPESRVRALPEGPCWTTPVLAGGLLYCRSSTGRLVCRDHRDTDR